MSVGIVLMEVAGGYIAQCATCGAGQYIPRAQYRKSGWSCIYCKG